MAFCAKHLDFEKSPYTGLTRESWIEAGEYLLEGVFHNISSMDAPVVLPRKETTVSYPHDTHDECEIKAEYFEGLTRTFFIASPLIHINPELTICGYRIKDYYKTHVLRSCTKGDPLCVGHYEDMQMLTGDKTRCFQQTVETCALVICLWITKEEIWDTYTKEEKDTIAEFLMGYAIGITSPQNWRLFNMLVMAFLHMEGYEIDKEIMLNHAQAVLGFYAGDGWYRDGHSFDYYSCWAFQLYAPIWNQWYGYVHEPYIASQFEKNSNELMTTYPDFFDQDGYTNMWGRSNIYRNAATSAFAGNLLLKNSTADPGLARRIMSGSLMQFFGREDFLYHGIPTLGFYGQFTPLVQPYSCAESPYWLGKAFLCLSLPENHLFWTATENNGSWETLKEASIKTTTLDGPALCFSNHQANGSTILRTGKVVKKSDDIHGMWNYSKLCFHTKYPWEATPKGGTSEDLSQAGKVEARQYVLEDFISKEIQRCNVTFWHGEKDGVLYRRQFFGYTLDEVSHYTQALNLADFPVANGIIRADKMRFYWSHGIVTLGSYGFPDNGTEIYCYEQGDAKAIVLKGYDSHGKEKQMAMTVWDGWDDISYMRSKDTNPDSEYSIIIYGTLTRTKMYGYEPFVMISQVITKESHEDFSKEELFPIATVSYTDSERCGGYGPVVIQLKNGISKIIDFNEMESRLML